MTAERLSGEQLVAVSLHLPLCESFLIRPGGGAAAFLPSCIGDFALLVRGLAGAELSDLILDVESLAAECAAFADMARFLRMASAVAVAAASFRHVWILAAGTGVRCRVRIQPPWMECCRGTASHLPRPRIPKHPAAEM